MHLMGSISRSDDQFFSVELCTLGQAMAEITAIRLRNQSRSPEPQFGHHMLSAIIELTISLSFSRRALTAFLRETLAWAITRSISLASRPLSSTSSPSSSSSSFLASVSGALPLPWSWSWS